MGFNWSSAALPPGFWKQSILGPLPPLPIPRFLFRQNVVVLLVAIPTTYLEAADKTNRCRFQNPAGPSSLPKYACSDKTIAWWAAGKESVESLGKPPGGSCASHANIMGIVGTSMTFKLSNVAFYERESPADDTNTQMRPYMEILNCETFKTPM